MPIYRLSQDLVFPPPHLAEDGLLAVGGDLRPERILLAYRHGIFPWYSAGEPILWWSPDPRMVFLPSEFHVSRRLGRILRSGRFHVTLDTAFEQVIKACATVPRTGQDGTWITPEMMEAYTELHRLGYAHSAECWRDGELAGGIYGIALGVCFFGESMFSRQSNASKVVLATLAEQFKRWGVGLIDCQVPNDHLRSLGAREIPRPAFLKLLAQGLRPETRCGPWCLDDDLRHKSVRPDQYRWLSSRSESEGGGAPAGEDTGPPA